MLLRAGADVRLGAEDGFTPIHMAAVWGLAYIIPTLLAAGAEVDAIWHETRYVHGGLPSDETNPRTPLESAIAANQNGQGDRTRVFAMLLRAGARLPTVRHLPGRTYRSDLNLGPEWPPYLDAVTRAGGYARYERAHRARLAAIFIPKFPRVPAEIIRTIVAFWADCGGH